VNFELGGKGRGCYKLPRSHTSQMGETSFIDPMRYQRCQRRRFYLPELGIKR